MPWEGFLLVVKTIFDMTNYKNATFTVCSFWSMKTALRMKNASETGWFDEIVYPCCEELEYDLFHAAKISLLVSALMQNRMHELHAVRHLSSFQRGSVEVKLGNFIVFGPINDTDSSDVHLVVGRVVEIVQAFSIGSAVIRIRLDTARETGEVDAGRGGVFTVLESEQCMPDPIICDVEPSTICELHAWLEKGRYTFTH